jgi:hypothetical protein
MGCARPSLKRNACDLGFSRARLFGHITLGIEIRARRPGARTAGSAWLGRPRGLPSKYLVPEPLAQKAAAQVHLTVARKSTRRPATQKARFSRSISVSSTAKGR